ncbi:YqaJ viral recombinase family protein [Paraoerskovia sediminicola]|uniref:YqaJ viral recombinase family protein n=1 Tax=Paraoerskovia sediminicola TaxID=1138587 RepID=UPI0025741BB6|nr:YqaJ viral recombinase family protein [Paraoerskovia sediminicola]
MPLLTDATPSEVTLSVSVPAPDAVRYWTAADGRPVGSEDRDSWLAARRSGVTATDCSKIVRRNGVPSLQRQGLLEKKAFGTADPEFWGYAHGREREPIIAAWVRDEFGIEHNDRLCAGEDPRHLATPDGIGSGVVAEIKTSVLALRQARSRYADQVQWQMHVTGAERCLFVVENRYTLERETAWIGRDEARLAVLVEHAGRFLADLDGLRARIAERERRMADRLAYSR